MKKMLTLMIILFLSHWLLGRERWPDGSVMGKWFQSVPGPVKGREARPFDITDYGAVPDSTVLQTEALQRAIDAAAEKGGTVVIPRGTWLSGALFFKEKTHLYLEEGAVLKGSPRTEDFPDVPVHIEGVLQPYAAALINAENCKGFSIRGKGTLDGSGLPYWEAFWARRKENPACTNLEVRRPRMVGLSHCSNVTIEGISLRNAAFWNIHLYKCNKVYIGGVSIHAPVAPVKAPSSDGIDLDACTDVHIISCGMATGDDLIAVKGGKGPWADQDPDNGGNARILVEKCTFGHCPGVLVFGSECIEARNVVLQDSKVSGADRLLWLKMRPDTPQNYSFIRVDRVKGQVKNVVFVKPWTQFFDLKGREDIPRSAAENVTIQRCTLTCRRSRNIEEAPDQYSVTGLTYKDNKWKWDYNREENHVKPYTLPDPLAFADGRAVTASDWPLRRKEILGIFQREMYGEMPPASPVFLETTEEVRTETALRRNVRMTFREDGSGPQINWMILSPVAAKTPAPAVLLLNFDGNDKVLEGKAGNSVFPTEAVLSRGYAFVTACYKDVSPDPDSLQNPEEQLAEARTGVFDLWEKDCTAGSIMAWAWALCRGMDMLEKDPAIDASWVLLTGSSRLGKTALVAAAMDERFAVVALNQTGGGGAPLSKRSLGEYVASEVEHFGYWWCRTFAKYAEAEDRMPFDQHMLLSCIAPRPLLVEGFNNPWFDTRGEFEALRAASPVWALLGKEGLPEVPWPDYDDTSAIGPTVGYVRRRGEHGFYTEDWNWMLDFADPYLQ